jgi:predicted phosphodiesterase
MKICIISDTHNKYKNLIIEPCDLLISCGDYSGRGLPDEVKKFHAWLNKQEAGHIISLQGNHELGVEKDWNLSKAIALEECPAVHFVYEEAIEIEGLKIYCSSWTPFFHNWAWNAHRGPQIKTKWDKIPLDTNILVCHGMPYGILDSVYYANGDLKENVGCRDLLEKIKELKNLDLFFGGHLHADGGREAHIDGVSYYNCAIVGEMYLVENEPRIVYYERD